MVVFTCNHCGESLQKPKVEKHYTFACRMTKSLTCVDCFKDFRGEEYTVHTKCITEDERYAAKGTYANGIIKKGEVKQESWIEMIKSILDKETDMKPSCRTLLHNICNFSNVPRKKDKFMNFIKSTTGGRANMRDVEEVWNIIESYKMNYLKNKDLTKNDKTSKPAEQELDNTLSEEKNSKNEENITKKRKKSSEQIKQDEIVTKRKKKCEGVETSLTEGEVVQEVQKFRFQDVILEIVTARESISLKKLQKKVMNAYLKHTGEAEITPKIIKKFNKKLKKLSELVINDSIVALKTAN